uniref:Polybromo-1 n=1 Tax=Strigamia maritima TaxID=126957 RepID=T1J6Q3_STRMM
TKKKKKKKNNGNFLLFLNPFFFQLIDRKKGGSPKTSLLTNTLEELFSAVMTACDIDGSIVSSSFQLLPSRRRYPRYYSVITEPMDLKMVASKIQNKQYNCLDSLERDLTLIVENAKRLHEPGSQVYKDAMSLRRVIANKKTELEASGRMIPAKTSERIRAKRLAGNQSLSSITAALQYDSEAEESMEEEEEEDEDEDTIDPEDTDNPRWLLYETIRTFQNAQAYVLSEPFLRLPSRRAYPDYYKEIKNPISLCNIRSKIKSGQYSTVNEVMDDLNLMFENAKHYNRADSRIYKDAVKLQKVMQNKAKDLVNMEKDYESDSDSFEDKTIRRKNSKKIVCSSEDKRRSNRRSVEPDSNLKKKMRLLYKTLVDFNDESGRPLITMFMEKPSRKDYPDYYHVINDPIDMKTIDINIRNDKYLTEEALVNDFKLMFSNCRQYNEEESLIYRDADTLEHVLMVKIKELDIQKGKSPGRKRKLSPQLHQKMKLLFDTIKDYTDNRNRKCSLIFMKLPSKTDYPDYYEVIKKPIDMQKIQSKLQTNQYESLEELVSDFVLMFDNACKYNEPDSQIYKDALTLQRIALQTKVELSESDEGVPDMAAMVQEMLTSLFISVYNHQDEEGRCYSDSLVELSESTETSDEEKMLSLDCIKRNLDKGRYRRLDRFQEDMFDVFDKARRLSRTDSQVFEDSVELQSYLIKCRDDLCKNGQILQSPALNYTERDLQINVERVRREKLPKERETTEEETEKFDKEKERASQRNSESVSFGEQVYRLGEFVYIEPREKGLEPHVIHIDKLWKDEQGEQWIYGCWFYRPNETFHLANRKFLEKEVFKSDNYNSTLMSQVLGKCYVMFVKDYFKMKPEGFEDKDVFVCESRYSAKAKAFKKIKVWPVMPNHPVKLIIRHEPLTPVRVPSVFKETGGQVKEENSDLDEFDCKMVEKTRPNVEIEAINGDDTCIYYEQYNIPSGCFKLGDCVYVRSENGKQLIARVDKIWVEKSDSTSGYFHGPWFVFPHEIPHSPTRLFYKQEVFLSSIEDSNPLLSITGRCAVMEPKDYMQWRCTEISENDIYVCDSRYMEVERQVRKLMKGLKKYVYSPRVIPDEIYYFRKPINLPKTELSGAFHTHYIRSKISTLSEPSPLLPKVLSDMEMEDSNDGQAPSVGSSDTPTQPQNATSSTSSKKKPLRRLVTGYILFASEVRKSFIAQNPDSSFGEISRIVGTEWRNLPPATKSEYEERAQKMNEESAAKEVAAENLPNSPASGDAIYECNWDNCDYQFEDHQDFVEHLIQEASGHVHRSYQHLQGKENEAGEKGEFQCLWQGCSRLKKNIPPFPNIQRLVRHCKDVHIKSAGKSVNQVDKTKNFVPSRNTVILSSPGANRALATATNQAAVGQKPADPIFVLPPPKTQRLLHSEAYIRYIEGLDVDNPHVSNWDTHLKATQENTSLSDKGRLPVHWLGNGVGNHGNVANALWALRDFMLKDALSISTV